MIRQHGLFRSSLTPVFQVGDYIKYATVEPAKSLISKIVAVQLDYERYQTIIVYHPSHSEQVGETGFMKFSNQGHYVTISESQLPGSNGGNGTSSGFNISPAILILAGLVLLGGKLFKK
jgi:hypothetical protein